MIESTFITADFKSDIVPIITKNDQAMPDRLFRNISIHMAIRIAIT